MAAGDFGRRAFALHAGRHNQHVGAAPAPAEHFQKIAHGRSGRTGDDGDPPGKARQRPFARRVEQSLGRQLFAQLPQRQFQRPKSLGLNLLDHQLIAAARRVDIEMPWQITSSPSSRSNRTVAAVPRQMTARIWASSSLSVR